LRENRDHERGPRRLARLSDLCHASAVLRVLFAVVAVLATPAVAQAADTPLTGLTSASGDLRATGATIASTATGRHPTVRVLHGATFRPVPAAAQGRVLDLGTNAAGKPVLVRAKCRGGIALCTTPLAATTPVRKIALVDRKHCQTTGAAIDHGRIALAVVARKGRAGQRCRAGIYSGGKRRVAVKHWRIGNPVELFRLGVTLDLRGATALLRIAQSSFAVGDNPDTIQQLRTVALTSGRSHTLATAAAVENNSDGELLSDSTLGPGGVTAVGQCRQGEGEPTTTEVLRWPAGGGAARSLTNPPFPDVAAATGSTRGLTIRAADGSAILRTGAAFMPRPKPPTLNCRLTSGA
jgi:hypothetical protein